MGLYIHVYTCSMKGFYTYTCTLHVCRLLSAIILIILCTHSDYILYSLLHKKLLSTFCVTHIVDVVVELVRNDTEFGELESSRDLPRLVAWVSTVPNKLMEPVSLTNNNSCT